MRVPQAEPTPMTAPPAPPVDPKFIAMALATIHQQAQDKAKAK